MRFENGLEIGINNYLGLYENGVMALLSINYNDDYYEGTYWYNLEGDVITIDERLCEFFPEINDDKEYDSIIEHLKNKRLDYNDALNELKEMEI